MNAPVYFAHPYSPRERVYRHSLRLSHKWPTAIVSRKAAPWQYFPKKRRPFTLLHASLIAVKKLILIPENAWASSPPTSQFFFELRDCTSKLNEPFQLQIFTGSLLFTFFEKFNKLYVDKRNIIRLSDKQIIGGIIMKKFLFLFIAVIVNAFCSFAEEGIPELVFDKDDPELAIGIKLNLPGSIANKIIQNYLKGENPEDFNGRQEAFNEIGESLKGNYKLLAEYIIQQYKRGDLYIPGIVLEDNFLQKLQGLYYNGLVTCGCCSNLKYWAKLQNLICIFF